MSGPILHKSAAILLVGAAPTSPEVVTKGFSAANSIVAVDGGLESVRDAGLAPDLVVGDFDSVHLDALNGTNHHQLYDQNRTDFEKALAVCDAPLFIGVGFLGGRLDHQLANLSILLKDRRAIILIDDQQLVFCAPRSLEIDLPDGTDVGFYPLTPARADISGVKWPVIDGAMDPVGLISTSNKVEKGPLHVSAMGGLLVNLPIAHLDAVVLARAGSL